MDNAIQFDGVTKQYRRTKALEDVSFNVPAESVTALIGPNGAGKTTIMKIISGLIRFDGKVMIDRQDFSDMSGEERIGKIFFVPEDKSLDINKKVSQYIRELDVINSSNLSVDFDRLTALMSEFKLDHKRDEPVRELSLGMRTAFYLAVALSSSAKIRILDEPLTGLDPIIRERIINKIKESVLNGMTVFYSSHILEEIEEVADRIIIINHGRILYTGLIDDIKEHFGEYIIEKPQNPERFEQLPGVLHIRQNPQGILNLFVDNRKLTERIPAKYYKLKLKEIFHYLIEMDELNYS